LWDDRRPMAFAILSDIHANKEAFLHVLDDLQNVSVDRIVCLGDLIGYGPDPCETVELARRTFSFCLKGNHEHAVLFDDMSTFNQTARISTEWTKAKVRKTDEEPDDDNSGWSYLTSLREWRHEDEYLFVHATPAEPLRQYLTPEDTENHQKMDEVFERVTNVSFGGHTHVPGVFEEDDYRFLEPDAIDRRYTLNDRKAHVNVGSVGQPRDGNPDACYVIVDGDDIHFRRVAYDVTETANKIFEHETLPDTFGEQLLHGKAS
jgi:predicted phosphodiesterase